MSADAVFAAVAHYLRSNGWWQDGQDPGLWRKNGDEQLIGGALDSQLITDGFSPWVYRGEVLAG